MEDMGDVRCAQWGACVLVERIKIKPSNGHIQGPNRFRGPVLSQHPGSRSIPLGHQSAMWGPLVLRCYQLVYKLIQLHFEVP